MVVRAGQDYFFSHMMFLMSRDLVPIEHVRQECRTIWNKPSRTDDNVSICDVINYLEQLIMNINGRLPVKSPEFSAESKPK